MVVQDGGTPPRSATGTAHITVLDENDHAPSFIHARPDRELVLQVRREGEISYISKQLWGINFYLSMNLIFFYACWGFISGV